MTTEDHEERLRRALVTAVEALDAPDRGRLAAIERRLLQRRRRPRVRSWWWALAGLGLAVGATAAYLELSAPGRAPAGPGGESTRAAPADAAGADPESLREGGAASSGAGQRDDDGPIIYQGE